MKISPEPDKDVRLGAKDAPDPRKVLAVRFFGKRPLDPRGTLVPDAFEFPAFSLSVGIATPQGRVQKLLPGVLYLFQIYSF